MCDELSNNPSCKRCGGTGVVWKLNGEPPEECDCKRDWQPDAALSCSAPATGSVSPLSIANALENFENALRHLQCVLFRDGVGEILSDYLCELDDEIMRFKKQNSVIDRKECEV